MRILFTLTVLCLVAIQLAQSLGPLPSKWPSTVFDIGRSSDSGASYDKQAGMRFRYQYLVGDVTGYNWKDWNSPSGEFVNMYMQDSIQYQVTPVFTYYTIVQSSPNAGDESQTLTKIQNNSLMKSWYSNLVLAFQKIGAYPNNVAIMHMEPDLWGFMQQQATNDDATTIPVSVQSSGHADLTGFANNGAGFAKALLYLRNKYAPNCLLAYHISIWGTLVDIITQDPSSTQVVTLGNRAATWYNSFGANFDIAFGEFTDKDSGAYQSTATDGTPCLAGKAGCPHWATSQDFTNVANFFGAFTSNTNKRLVLWQVPLGNTKMRTCNNVQYHFQSNHVETFLGDSRTTLQNYINAGVVAILFGPGCEDWCTTDFDDAGDGITNPSAINGNTIVSSSSDDEGGYFKSRTASYYNTGAISLLGASTSAPTTTKPPTTKPPTTRPPTTRPPTTKPPTTLAPTTKAPTTKPPTTLAPTTKAPTTKAPTTLAPTTKAPTTRPPTTRPPTTTSPTARPPHPSGASTTDIRDLYFYTQSGSGYYLPRTWGATCKGVSQSQPYPAFVSSSIRYTASLSQTQFFGGQVCGACIQVTGREGTFLAYIDDRCDNCDPGFIDINKNQSPMETSSVTWRIVDCPVGNTKLTYIFIASSEWYLKFQILGARIPIETARIRKSDGTYISMTRTQYDDNMWEILDNSIFPIQWPITLSLTSFAGETITDQVNYTGSSGAPADGVETAGSGAQFSVTTA